MLNANWKKYALMILAAVGGILVIVTQCINDDGGTTPPEPPANTSTIQWHKGDPKMLNGTWETSTPVLYGAKGEILDLVIQTNSETCLPLSISGEGVTAKFFQMDTIQTYAPSYQGALTGSWYDPLPVTSQLCSTDPVWAEIHIAASADDGPVDITVGDLPVQLNVLDFTMPVKPALPVYMEIGSWALVIGYGLPSNTHVSVQGPLTQVYVDALREHRVEPYKQYVAVPEYNTGVLNVDKWAEFGASFRQIVVDGALAPIQFPATVWDGPTESLVLRPEAYFRAVEVFIQSEGIEAWTYLWDEPPSSIFTRLAGWAVQIKQWAPSLKIMITTEAHEVFRNGVTDILAPVMDQYNVTGRIQAAQYTMDLWLYTSCMEHGCGIVGVHNGVPGMVVEHTGIHPRIFASVAWKLGAKAALYYNTTEGFPQGDDPYERFHGNYDGIMFHPGDQAPISSVRLKLVRRGTYDVEYLSRAPAGTVIPITDAFNWEHNWQTWDDLILSIKKGM